LEASELSEVSVSVEQHVAPPRVDSCIATTPLDLALSSWETGTPCSLRRLEINTVLRFPRVFVTQVFTCTLSIADSLKSLIGQFQVMQNSETVVLSTGKYGTDDLNIG
jgi:hypothetical protein